MTYRIAREGQLFGPYSAAEVQRYLAAGNIVAADLALPAGGEEWLPVGTLFPQPALTATPPGAADKHSHLALFADPPNMHWGVALLLGCVTLAGFFVIWDIVQSAWLRRVDRSSTAVYYYVAVALVYLLKLPNTWRGMQYNFGSSLAPEPSHLAWPLFWLGIVLLIASRFVFRSELCRHFNGPEPIGLRLGGLMTLLFGGIYFQYHFNRINQVKRALRISVPSA